MKFLNKLGLFLALSLGLACAQSTTVTGQLTDPDGITWNGATVTATFNPAPNYTGSYTWTGGPIVKVVNGVANGTGAFSISVMDNNTVIPAGTKWSFSFCPQVSTVCINTTPIVITGASQNINSLITATIPPLRVNPNNAAQAYNDMQVSVVPGTGVGQVYYNTNSHAMRQWNGTVWGPFVGNVFLPATTTLIAGDGTGNGAVGTSAIVATLLSGATNCSDPTKAYNPATNTCIASSANPGGTTTQVQFNDASAFGGSKVTYTKGGAADGTLTLFNGRLANRSDVIDLVADWGVVIDYNSGVGTDNCTALTNALASNPKGRFFLPPSNGGFAFSSCDITLQKSGQLFSTSFGYNQDNGAHNFPFNPNTGFGIPGSNLIFASGVNGIHRQEGSVVHDIGIVGLDPGPRFVTDTNLAIIPAGQFLSLYIDSTVVSVVRTSNVVTATFGPAFPPWFNPKGIIKVVGATPSDLNGTFYVVSSGMSGSQGVMTWNQTGVNESASVMPSIQPGTTGLNHSSGMMIEGTKTITYNTAISNFANNCFEVTPGPSGTFISDDTQFDNSWVAGCGNAGLAILGGNDTSKGVYNHLNLYFNQLYNLNASSFLGDKFNQPQSSYPSLYNGLNAGATVNITTATTVAGLITVQTAASHGLKIGNGAIILGTTQSAHNLPISGTISCWVLTVPDATHFTCQLPSNASSVTSTGGTVNLPGKNDFLTGFGADTGHYAVGRHGLSAHNSLDEPYAEGGGVGVNPDGCGARFNGSVIIKQPHTGDPFCGGSIVQSDGNFGLTFLADALTAATGGLNITARGAGFLPSIFKVDSTGLTNAIGGFLTAGGFGTNVASVAQFGFLSGNAAIVGYGPNGSTVGGALLGGITSTGGSFTQYLTCTLGTGCTLGVPITLNTATTGCVSGTAGVLSIASGIPCGTLRTGADVVGQWTSCTSGWLAFNLTCSSPTAATQRGANAVNDVALDKTGGTDIGTPLSTYINALSGTTSIEIFFPCGTYLLNNSIHITTSTLVSLIGESTAMHTGANPSGCTKFVTSANINMLWFDFGGAGTNASERGPRIEHIAFVDTSTNGNHLHGATSGGNVISAIRLTQVNNFDNINDVTFSNMVGLNYNTGTIAATAGSATVTGTGTTWTSAMVGGLLWFNGYPHEIAAVGSTTSITLVQTSEDTIAGSGATGTTTISGSSLATATSTANGSGYTAGGAYVSITGGGCTGVQVTPNISGGAIATYNIVAAGTTCTSAPTLTVGNYVIEYGGMGLVMDPGSACLSGTCYTQFGTVSRIKAWNVKYPVVALGGSTSSFGTSRVRFYGGYIDCRHQQNSIAWRFGGFSDTMKVDVAENNCNIGGYVEKGHQNIFEGNYEVAGGTYPNNPTCTGYYGPDLFGTKACNKGILIRGDVGSNTRANTVTHAQIQSQGVAIELGKTAQETMIDHNNLGSNTTNILLPAAGNVGYDTTEIDEQYLKQVPKATITQLQLLRSGVSTNTDLDGQVTLAAGTGTYNFTGTYTSAPICTANDTTATNAVRVSATTTVLTLTGTTTDVINYHCVGRN